MEIARSTRLFFIEDLQDKQHIKHSTPHKRDVEISMMQEKEAVKKEDVQDKAIYISLQQVHIAPCCQRSAFQQEIIKLDFW